MWNCAHRCTLFHFHWKPKYRIFIPKHASVSSKPFLICHYLFFTRSIPLPHSLKSWLCGLLVKQLSFLSTKPKLLLQKKANPIKKHFKRQLIYNHIKLSDEFQLTIAEGRCSIFSIMFSLVAEFFIGFFFLRRKAKSILKKLHMTHC